MSQGGASRGRGRAAAGEPPLRAALEAVRAPLAFAARDDFAQLARVRELAPSVAQACRRAAALCIPEEWADELVRLAEAFEAAADEVPRKLIEQALERTGDWFGPDAEEAALLRPVTTLSGVGPRRARALDARGLRTVGDLLWHFPVRYDDRRSLERVGDLEVGQHATFLATVASCDATTVPMRGRFRRVLRAVVGDESGSVVLKWFRAPESLQQRLEPGTRLIATGDVKRYRFDLEIVHPELEILAAAPGTEGSSAATPEALDAALDAHRRIVPEYATPDGVPARTFRGWVARAVDEARDLVPGHLPAALVAERKLPEPADALRMVHAPDPESDPVELVQRRSPAHERLVLEELFLLTLGLGLRQAEGRKQDAPPLDPGPAKLAASYGALPFELTGAQRRSWGEIAGDLARPHPMHRLLQGDVGSGKTAVAFLAAMTAVACGRQAVFMAPTELLAEQHARTLRALVAGLPEGERPGVEILSASLPRAQALATREGLETGRLPIAVGTHALLAGDLRIPGLGVAIVDEQHRFGVRQRAALAALAGGHEHPHVLVMTATPIPRTLALTVYGDLDVSVIDELPPGRAPVETLLLRSGEGRQVVDRVREATARGEQVYVVYPMVDESEKVDLRAAVAQTEKIRAAFPELQIDLVHGRLDAAERGAAMQRFASGETQVLVATTVIEVGVDVPNATLMIIEHAERFGLAQLHQLRGRVGRGEAGGTCLLVARGGGRDAEDRLRAMLETTDGFAIADADLRIRGPGEFLGTRQSGHLPDLRIADLVRDARLVSVAREAALELLRAEPGLARQPRLRRAVERRWGDRLSLSGVG